jgi:hypothetical protein
LTIVLLALPTARTNCDLALATTAYTDNASQLSAHQSRTWPSAHVTNAGSTGECAIAPILLVWGEQRCTTSPLVTDHTIAPQPSSPAAMMKDSSWDKQQALLSGIAPSYVCTSLPLPTSQSLTHESPPQESRYLPLELNETDVTAAPPWARPSVRMQRQLLPSQILMVSAAQEAKEAPSGDQRASVTGDV